MKELTAFEKLEFVENLFKVMGLDFNNVTIDRAFTIYREVFAVVEKEALVNDEVNC
jgi:hypothetical protein